MCPEIKALPQLPSGDCAVPLHQRYLLRASSLDLSSLNSSFNPSTVIIPHLKPLNGRILLATNIIELIIQKNAKRSPYLE